MEPSTKPPLDYGLLSFVAAAGQELRPRDDLPGLVQAAANSCVPGLADVAVLQVQAPGHPSHIAVAHGDSRKAALVEREMHEHLAAFAQGARGRAERWGRLSPLWVRRITPPALRLALGPGEHEALAQLLRRVAVTSLIVVELEVDDHSLGWMAMGRGSERAEFGAGELAAAVVLARRLSLLLHASMLREERTREAAARGRAEASLRKWSQAFMHAGWGAAIIDERTRTIEAVNPAFAQLHGFEDPAAVTGRLFDDLFLGPGGEPAAPLLPTQGTVTYETHHRRADDHATFPVMVGLTAVPGENGAPGHFAAYIQDLSDLKRAEDRLREVERLEAVGRLAGGVAHEVNNMMTIVIGYADLVLGMAELPEDAKEELRQIRQAADHAAGVSKQLLAYSRREVLRPVVVDLEDIVRSAARFLAPLLPTDIQLDIRLGHGTDTGVHVDRGQLERIIVNLALNARDAMRGGGRFELSTDYREVEGDFGVQWLGFAIPPGRYAFITAKDTGAGMDAETQAHLFEPFFTTKPVGQGTGLGLSTTYGIVKQSGGYIWVESAPGVGTTFTLCFPAMPLERAQQDRRTRGRGGGAGTILVVDDEPAVRNVCTRLLRGRGYDAIEAACGADALAELEQLGDSVRAVLTDIVMTDMSGPELRARIEVRWPHMPVLFMSGHPGPELVERGLLAEGERLLQKPFTAGDLSAAVAEALNREPRLSSGGRTS
ncbi:MAG TPA: response regulator [Gemmatimonadales bacterium]|nr:response regulator [Gemmatimonadales bacterium]